MPTALERRVSRRTVGAISRGRRLVVSLLTGDLVGVREERARHEYYVPIAAIWQWAMRAEVEARRRIKRRK